jgi:hypothetical protein
MAAKSTAAAGKRWAQIAIGNAIARERAPVYKSAVYLP